MSWPIRCTERKDGSGDVTHERQVEAQFAGKNLAAVGGNRLPGRRADGTYYEVPGVSTLEYAGDGKFSFEEDIINMVHLNEVLEEFGWVPGPELKLPDKVIR